MARAVAWPRPQLNAYERPFITGGTVSGSTATVNANTAAWHAGGGAVNTFGPYQWWRGTATIANATAASYGITSTERGSGLTCYVSATNKYGAGAFPSLPITIA
jgi:hypothetical protein